jgi:hypothetical protein
LPTKSSQFASCRAPWIIAISIAAVAHLLSQSATAGEPLQGPNCEVIGAGHQFLLALRPAPEEKREIVAQLETRQPSHETARSSPAELLLPPQEQELRELSGVLKALANPDTSASTLAALNGGQPFSLNRFAVLMGDVRAIEIHLQAQELRSRLEKADRMSSETRTWIEPRLAVMENCASARFAERGGSQTYQDAVSLVQKWRHDLQPFVFQASSVPQRGPATPSKTTGPQK